MKNILLVLLIFTGLNAFGHIEGEHQLGSIGGVSEEYLQSSISLLTGVGTDTALAVTSSLVAGSVRDEAIYYTQQGIALNHAFQWEDAVRSFYEALRRDPQMARAYVGLSQSFTMLNRDSSKLQTVLMELMDKAKTAAESLQNNEQDRLWVDLINAFYQAQYNLPPVKKISSAGKTVAGTGMSVIQVVAQELLQKYNDPEVYAFVGWDLGQQQILNAGYQQFPSHSGILHYLVHINENTGRYNEAIRYADELVKIAPDAPHITHMYGHVLPMVGKWAEANNYFLLAHCNHQAVLRLNDPMCAGVSVTAAMSSYTPAASEFWHYSHNLELFGFSLMRTRDIQTAERIFQERCRVGDCMSLYQFYFGEKMYEKILRSLPRANNSVELSAMRVQALVMTGKVQEAKQLFSSLGGKSSLEVLSAALSIGFAEKSVSSSYRQQLQRLIDAATTNPNFDSWSHMLPVLRKLHNYADFYGAAETTMIYDAIQKIDPGHPL